MAKDQSRLKENVASMLGRLRYQLSFLEDQRKAHEVAVATTSVFISEVQEMIAHYEEFQRRIVTVER